MLTLNSIKHFKWTEQHHSEFQLTTFLHLPHACPWRRRCCSEHVTNAICCTVHITIAIICTHAGDNVSLHNAMPTLRNRLPDTLQSAEDIAPFQYQLKCYQFSISWNVISSVSVEMFSHPPASSPPSLEPFPHSSLPPPPTPFVHHLHQVHWACGCLHGVKLCCAVTQNTLQPVYRPPWRKLKQERKVPDEESKYQCMEVHEQLNPVICHTRSLQNDTTQGHLKMTPHRVTLEWYCIGSPQNDTALGLLKKTPHRVTSVWHHTGSPQNDTTQGHLSMTPHRVTSVWHHTGSPHTDTTQGHLRMTPHRVTSVWHHTGSPRTDTTQGHLRLTPHRVTSEWHCTGSPQIDTAHDHDKWKQEPVEPLAPTNNN